MAAAVAVASGGSAFSQEATPPVFDQPTYVVLEADSLINDEQGQTITAEGAVEARYQGRVLRADRLVYDLKTRRISAQGGVEIVDPDGQVRQAEEMEVDEDLNTGLATGFADRIPGGGTAAAQSAIRRSESVNEIQRVIYTACPVCKPGEKGDGPTWTLRARRAVQNKETDMIAYRDAVLRVGSVPVIYLPYFAHPDPSSGPKSGLLPPDLGSSRRLGAYYEQPYYWAISPSQDATISPRLHEQVNPLLNVQYRQRLFSGQFTFDGSITQDRDFDGNGEKFGEESVRAHVFGEGLFAVNDRLNWGFGVERSSDDLYLKRYRLDGEGERRGPFIGDAFRLISQLYAVTQTPDTYGNVAFVSFQGLREFDTERELPLILPVGEFEHVTRDPRFDGQLKLQASTAQVYRSEGIDSARGSLGAEWRRDRVLPGGLVAGPFAMARGDLYRVGNNTPAAKDETFARGVGLAGVEVRWPFLRAGKSVDVIVEPIGMAAIGSNGGNDIRIANEDSVAFELDETNLFRPNAAPNYDLWEPGPRVSFGVRATARARNGHSASLMVGQRWRQKDEAAFTNTSNLRDNASDYVAAASADLGPNLSMDVRTRLDQKDLSLTRIDAGLRGSLWRVSANARYFKTSNTLRPGSPNNEISGSMGLRLTNKWSVSYGLQRDLNLDRTLTQNARLIYRDDCTFFEVAYIHSETFDRVLGPNDGVQVRLGLSSLGVFGGGD
jgi:LPS-assembly protein